MKRSGALCMLALVLSLWMAFSAAAEPIVINPDLEAKTYEEVQEMLAEETEAYLRDEALAEEMKGEIRYTDLEFSDEDEGDVSLRIYELTHGGQTMRFLMDVKGEADDTGRYPLYITLHGGGESEPEGNDSEWYFMYNYYRDSVENGIYIACRGITDTWDLHFQSASYPLYDRLIQAMILLYHADPDRVYLLGFSAGGDGVYQIAPRMADRFAAANMSSGHPNGVSLLNLANCPFCIQVGVRDYYSESAMRCVRAAEFDQVLADYHDQYGYGYEHRVLIHVPAGHNYNDHADPDDPDEEIIADPTAYASPDIAQSMMESFLNVYAGIFGNDDVSEMSYYPSGDNDEFDEAIRSVILDEFGLQTETANTNAVDYVNQFTRDPVPPLVVWDLSTRAPSRRISSFYWLKADPSVNQGLIRAAVGGDNTIYLSVEKPLNGEFSILVSPDLVDISQPVRIITENGEYEVIVHPSRETIAASIRETGDPNLAWVAEIPSSLLR